MQIETGRVHVFATMGEAHCEMGFVWPLVGRETGIAVDTKQRSTRAARVGPEMWCDFVERRCKIGNELDRGLTRTPLVFIFVGQKPITIVVALEPGEKAKEFGSKVGGHNGDNYLTRQKGLNSQCA